MPLNRTTWDSLNNNNATTFNTAIEILRGMNVKEGEKRLENDKLFRTQLLTLLGAISIALCVQNQLTLAQCEPSIMLSGTLPPINQKPL
jgi:hypothetical protein